MTTEIKDRKEKEENRERLMRMESSKSEFLKQVQQERHEAHLVGTFTCMSIKCVCNLSNLDTPVAKQCPE